MEGPQGCLQGKKKTVVNIESSTQFRAKLRMGNKENYAIEEKNKTINFKIKQKVVKESTCNQSTFYGLGVACMLQNERSLWVCVWEDRVGTGR